MKQTGVEMCGCGSRRKKEKDGNRGGEAHEGTFKFTSWSGCTVGRLRIVRLCKEERAGRLTVESPALNRFSRWRPPPNNPRIRSRGGRHPRSVPNGGWVFRERGLLSVPETSDGDCNPDCGQCMHNGRPSPCTTWRRASLLLYDDRSNNTQSILFGPS